MTALLWDQPGSRGYETGIDRGVLYPSDTPGVAWNGLASVVESSTVTVKSYFMDGLKFLDFSAPGPYSARLSAFTYPDELDLLVGSRQLAPGLYAHDQRPSAFQLSYRTRQGNDLEGPDHGYRIHLIYNVLAVPSDATHASIADIVNVNTLEFILTGAPSSFGASDMVYPSGHISVDSVKMAADKLSTLEDLLYGTDTTAPRCPALTEILGILG